MLLDLEFKSIFKKSPPVCRVYRVCLFNGAPTKQRSCDLSQLTKDIFHNFQAAHTRAYERSTFNSKRFLCEDSTLLFPGTTTAKRFVISEFTETASNNKHPIRPPLTKCEMIIQIWDRRTPLSVSFDTNKHEPMSKEVFDKAALFSIDTLCTF